MARQYRSTVEAKTLSTSINSSVTSMTLNGVTTLPTAYPYTLVIDPDTATEEIVSVTASAGGNALTITRAQDGTSGQAHNAAAVVKHMITARDLQEPQDHIDATAAHGATGAVVGTTNTQALTNKTINLTSNTLTGTTAQFNTALSDGNFATLAGTEILTNKTLTSPVVTGGTLNGGVALTVDSTELNKLDGVTTTTAELNKLAGATATTAQLNFVTGVTSAIQTQINTNTPVGTLVMYINASAPTGWLICDGSEQAVATYPDLATAIGANYGATTNGSGAAGSTHFRLPDLRGRAPIGFGTGRNIADSANLTARAFAFGSFSKVSDAETQTLTEANLPAHDHPVSFTRRSTTAETHDHDTASAGDFAYPPDDRSGAAEATTTVSKNTSTAGSGTAHNNMQPSTIVNFIVKY